MYGTIKSIGKRIGILAMVVMLVTAVPVGYISSQTPAKHVTPEPEHSGEAEALVPLAPAAAALAGTAVITAGNYVETRYFSDNGSDGGYTEDEAIEIANNSSNSTLRSSMHTEAINSEGTNQGYLDNVDNDQITIEAQVEQKASQAMLREGDNVTSETELINIAEQEASEYLKTRQSNLIETHNFQTLSVRNYNDSLDVAGYPDDIGAVKKVEVTSDTDLNSQPSVPTIYTLQNDIVLDGSTSTSQNLITTNADIVVNLNGYEIREADNASFSDLEYLIKGGNNQVVKNGKINTPNVSTFRIGNSGNKQLDIINVQFNHSITIESINSDDSAFYTSLNSTDYTTTGGVAVQNSSVQDIFGALQNITFNRTQIANANTAYDNASQVPTAEFEKSNSTVTLPAINITLDSTYYGANNTVQFAVPYNASTGEPLDVQNKTVIVKTPTSGTSSYAEPVDFQRSYDLLTTTDNLANQTYSSVSSYASQQWTKYIQDVASDENKSISDVPNLSKDLGQLTTPAPTNADEATIAYTGIYEGTTLPASDVIHIEEEDGDTYAGALFSTDMSALMNQTNSSDKVEEGDTFDVSVTNRTFIVSDENGATNELEGNVTVTLIEDKESADVREYGIERTDLAGQAQRLEDQANQTRRIVDNPGQFVPDSGSGSGQQTLLIAIVAIVAVAVLGGGGGTVAYQRRRRRQS
ncbi:hypothetical protein GRX03_01080 [Halovenus sp. WSH3]|uniref:Uncharacterized protein n=1 Tax=Halovenus carboxidivorans TaxID=2692199 RepID=A0A6B0SXA6_9EURY|nr:hypothetical protein [Halovenus carboxidivorans]MXR50204.1 hypothetical protein [Halovenus carboxidivorans]